jgi:hypothetical protein
VLAPEKNRWLGDQSDSGAFAASFQAEGTETERLKQLQKLLG